MVARAVEENLRLVLQAPKRARMNDAVTITLVMCPPFGWLLLEFATSRVRAELGVRREDLPLALFQLEARAGHSVRYMVDSLHRYIGQRKRGWHTSCNSCSLATHVTAS